MLALRSSKRHTLPNVTAISHAERLAAVNAGCSFQCLIGEIIGPEGFVNFVEIANIISHCITPKIQAQA
jgi:hypothetical protein